MKKIVVALLVIVLLGGGAGGAYFYFSKPAEASGGAKAEHAKQAKKEKHGEHVDAGVEFVELDPLILPIIDKNGVSQVVSMVVAIEVKNGSAATKARKMQPKLKDAFIQDMYGVLNKKAALDGGVIKVDVIKERLTKVSYRILGKDDVNGVLLQVVQQRPI